MALEQNLTSIEKSALVSKVQEMYDGGYRLVQIGATKTGDNIELNYSFDKDLSFVNYRLTISAAEDVPSISGVYWNSFIYENEIHDLFGVSVKDINIDFKGNFYKLAVPTPFASNSKTTEKSE